MIHTSGARKLCDNWERHGQSMDYECHLCQGERIRNIELMLRELLGKQAPLSDAEVVDRIKKVIKESKQ